MTFCYHQVLKDYFYQCWKRFYISWMIVGNYISYKKSDFYEISISISLASHCPLDVTSGMAWTTKGIDCFHPTTPSSSTPTYSTDWYCADFCKYILSIMHHLFLGKLRIVCCVGNEDGLLKSFFRISGGYRIHRPL